MGRELSTDSQREIDGARRRVLAGDERGGAVVRNEVRASWARSIAAHVDPALPRAPVSARQALRDAQAEWVVLTEELARGYPLTPSGEQHLFALFDAEAKMIGCHGDDRVRAKMAELNFAPGGIWDEALVGTNGPGTALATGVPVQIVGAEHFCDAWGPWQCAATPIRDPGTGRVLGAIDVSGPYQRAHPHTFELVRTLGLTIERTLLARSLERQLVLMRAYTDLRLRSRTDEVAVVDLAGRVVAASPGAPLSERTLVELDANGEPDLLGLARVSPRGVERISDGPSLVGWMVFFGAIVRERKPSGGTTRYTLDDLVGESPLLMETRRIATIAARNDLPVLLLGESGVGKEVVAQGIHAQSARHEGPFVAVNCAALPSELLESELFGHAPGAFTGAQLKGAPGRFEVADGGTLFLDEIGELSHPAQAALLRVLQEGEVVRLGSATPRKVDVRIIAATQREPGEASSRGTGSPSGRSAPQAVRAGRLRKDLYYRLAVLPCELPPLRERKSDIPALVARFLVEAATELGVLQPGITDAALTVLAGHDWPGNVRELKNLVRRLVAGTEGVIDSADLPPELARTAEPAGDPGRERFMEIIESSRTLRDAAERLGIGRSTLYRWMERYGLEPKRTLTPRG